MDLTRKIILSLGLSILVGLSLGYLTSEQKYYFLSPRDPKREITKENYEMYFDNRQSSETDYSKFTSKETEFNIHSAVFSGLLAFSILIIGISLFGKRIDKPIN